MNWAGEIVSARLMAILNREGFARRWYLKRNMKKAKT